MEVLERFNGLREGSEVGDLSSKWLLRLNENLKWKILKAGAVQFRKWTGMIR